MNFNEAHAEIQRFENIFKATQKLKEALSVAHTAEGQVAVKEKQVEDLEAKLAELEAKEGEAQDRVTKANQDADQRIKEVQATTDKKIQAIRQQVQDEQAKADASLALLADTQAKVKTELADIKQSRQSEMDAMQAEYNAMKTQLASLTQAADSIARKVSQVAG